MLNLKPGCRWAAVAPSSMGVRITPAGRQSVHVSTEYTMQATSAETNVLNVLSALGEKTLVLTAFVKDNPVARFIQAQLRARGIDYLGPEIEQGGPWGYRHQFNIADAGFGPRGPIVTNDRAGELGRELEASFYDLEEIFSKQGAVFLHLSGLIAALSEKTSHLCVDLARLAKKNGTAVSFDMNYRASFWQGRETELRERFDEIASLADVLSGADLLAFDYDFDRLNRGPEGESEEERLAFFGKMLDRVHAACPQTSVTVMNYREVLSANRHVFGAIADFDGQRLTAPPREIEVYDRIGGGDGFLGGLLYGLVRGYEPERCLALGWAAGALAVTEATDYATPFNEDQLLQIWGGNAKVRR